MTGRQANDQLDVFVVAQDGALYVLWEANNGPWSDPIALTPKNFAPPGGGVTAVDQDDRDDEDFHQLNALLVGNDGALYVLWEQNNEPWSGPDRITDAGFAQPGAALSAVHPRHSGPTVFLPRKDGTLCLFTVVGQFGGWAGPKPLTDPKTVDPKSPTVVLHHPPVEESNSDLSSVIVLLQFAAAIYREKRSRSVEVVMEAIKVIRPLTADDPALRRVLATWEASPAVPYLAAFGRWDEAVAAGEESVGLYRVLIAESPEDHELASQYAGSCIDIAMHWWAKVELREKSLALTLTATETLRTLTAKHPQYRPLLARWSASPHVAFLSAFGRWDEAVAAGEESVGLYRVLIAESPEDHEL
ncbi:hypothetical protein, partial [Streptomyces longispororuber]|uniref:hypothetical protein n=1 Tax=Streptomyces longispororuber TaxID=68230 RepID=UPI0036F82EC7